MKIFHCAHSAVRVEKGDASPSPASRTLEDSAGCLSQPPLKRPKSAALTCAKAMIQARLFQQSLSLRRSIRWNALRSIFIQTEETPNPLSLKFVPGEKVLPTEHGDGMFIRRSDAKMALRSPLAKRMFELEGVDSVFFGPDFVTVSKTKEDVVTWDMLRPLVFSQLMEHFSGKEVVYNAPNDDEADANAISEDDDEVVAMIKELLLTRIRPAVQEDGGDIFFHSFDPDTGSVMLEMAGSCAGCPSSSVTLKQGVESMLRHYIPEVVAVQEVENEELMTSSRDQEMSLEDRLRAAGIPRD